MKFIKNLTLYCNICRIDLDIIVYPSYIVGINSNIFCIQIEKKCYNSVLLNCNEKVSIWRMNFATLIGIS